MIITKQYYNPAISYEFSDIATKQRVMVRSTYLNTFHTEKRKTKSKSDAEKVNTIISEICKYYNRDIEFYYRKTRKG